jgi:hypothetical protein
MYASRLPRSDSVSHALAKTPATQENESAAAVGREHANRSTGAVGSHVKEHAGSAVMSDLRKISDDNSKRRALPSTSTESRMKVSLSSTVLPQLNDAIDHGDAREIETILNELPTAAAKKFLSQVHRNRFREALDNQHFAFIKSAVNVFPEKSKLFTLVQEPEESNAPHRTILSPAGVRTIVDTLKMENKLAADIPCVVCDDYDSLESEIRQRFSKKYAQSGPLELVEDEHGKSHSSYFLVRHKHTSVPEKYHVHFSAIYLKAAETSGTECFIADSNAAAHDERRDARDPGKDFSFRLASLINDVLPQSNFYTNLEGRQADKSNCPVFSILDVVQMQKAKDMLLIAKTQPGQDIRNSAFGPDFKIKGIVLPPTMMKVTQSLTKLGTYIDSLQNVEEKERLQLTVKKHAVQVGPRKINALVAKKYIKYERMLIDA